MRLAVISWKNLINKPLAMILSLVLFGLGVGLISLLFQLEKQLQDNFESNLAEVDLVIGAKGSPLQLILSSMYHVDAPTGNISLDEARPFLNPRHPLIEEVVPMSLGDSYRGFRLVGTTANILEWYGGKMRQGKSWEYNFDVTAGAYAASQLGLQVGDTFKSSHGLEDAEGLEHDDATDFKIVGILEPSGTVLDQLLLTTTQSFWLVHGEHDTEGSLEEEQGNTSSDEDNLAQTDHTENGHEQHDHVGGETPRDLLEEDGDREITSILARFKGRSFQALNMQRNINENTDLQAATPAIEINRLFSMMDSGEQALRILAIVIIFVSALSIFISLYSSLKERKYELALMRVIGAGRSQIFILIILEGLILALLGYVIGILLSHGGMEIIGTFMADSYRYNFHGRSFLSSEWLLLLASVVIGFTASFIPAIQASRTDISETLTQS